MMAPASVRVRRRERLSPEYRPAEVRRDAAPPAAEAERGERLPVQRPRLYYKRRTFGARLRGRLKFLFGRSNEVRPLFLQQGRHKRRTNRKTARSARQRRSSI